MATKYLPFVFFFFFVFFVLSSSTTILCHGFNITRGRGSSISLASAPSGNSSTTNSTSSSTSSFWLSPSGVFAFGFYPPMANDHDQEYTIGIWIDKSFRKTLVLSININNKSPLIMANAGTTSLLLNHNGKFVINQVSSTGEQKETPLLFNNHELPSPITYASILDNGNLVFYNSDSNIIWESFNYPTDTILQGQTLNPGKSLVSSRSSSDDYQYSLTMMKDGNLIISKITNVDGDIIGWQSRTTMKKTNTIQLAVMLNLDMTGHLYLVYSNGLIKKTFNKQKQQSAGDADDQGEIILYRATLCTDGVFRLYMDKIDGNASKDKEILAWDTIVKDNSKTIDGIILLSVVGGSALLLLAGMCVSSKPWLKTG